jgi:hypothetical protein
MKPHLSLFAILSLAVVAPTAFAQTKAPEAPKEAPKVAPAALAGTPVKEADYAKGLLGVWKQDIKQGAVTGEGITTYLEGGKATSVATLEGGGKKIEIKASAKWSLEKDKLTVEITESSVPQMMPVGAKITQTIIALTDKEFKYKEDKTGQEITETRVKAEEKKPAEEAKPAKK